MNKLLVPVLLALIAIGLGIGLVVRHNKALEQEKKDLATILSISNTLKNTSLKLDEAHGVIANLEKDVTARTTTIGSLSNELASTTNVLLQTRTELDATQQAVKEAKDEITKRNARITALEAENNSLDQRAAELTNAITGLNAQITDTRRQLAIAQGDKAFLEGQLKRLMAEKADLEKKFNDLEVLRAQVKKLKEELVVARRLDWIRRGLFSDPSVKGGQLLMQRSSSAAPRATGTNYDLNVEIGSDGTVRVLQPGTNAPATNAPAPR